MKFTSLALTTFVASLTSAAPSIMERATSDARILLGNSGHVYVADFSHKTGKLSISLEEEVVGAPSWMAFAPPNRLYAVDEFSAALRLFELDLENNKLSLTEEKNGSTGVVHLEFNADKTRLVGSAYGNGTVDVWNIENGALEHLKTIDSPGELGPNEQRQAAPHPHQANLDPSGRFFAVNDLGTDSIVVIDSKDDAFTVADNFKITPGGCGPRHGVFYPQGATKATHYIVVCEITNLALVHSVEYTDDSLTFKQIQSISTFGKDAPAANATTAAAGGVILSSNNKDLYISNRLTGNDTDSIAHFRVDEANCGTPKLTYSSTVSSAGLLPRMISLSKKSKYVFAGNQGGKSGLAAFKRNYDGKLDEKPVASIEASAFGEDGFGPQFVQQIA